MHPLAGALRPLEEHSIWRARDDGVPQEFLAAVSQLEAFVSGWADYDLRDPLTLMRFLLGRPEPLNVFTGLVDLFSRFRPQIVEAMG